MAINEQKRSARNPLARTMMIYCVLLTIMFSVCMGAMTFFVYEEDMTSRYNEYTRDILNYVVRETDGDDLSECIRSKKKSEKYLELQSLANDLKETHKLEFLYIIKPLSENPPDNMMGVLAAKDEMEILEADTSGDLGELTGDSYPPEVAREYLARMEHNPEVTFFQNNTEFGNIYTAIRPIFDSHGEPVAVVCADVLTDEINAGKQRFIWMSIWVAIISGTMLVAMMSFWLWERVANPIKRIRDSATSFAERCHETKDLDVISFEDPQIDTNDELEDLAVALSSMCDDMKAYTEELILADREMNVLKEKVVQMDTLAYKDALTGAGNKAAYEKFMTRVDWDILANKAEFAIIMTDLNYLKRINDTFGHDRGNAYIVKMYDLIRETFPKSPTFRIGGDEFVTLLQGEEYDVSEERIEFLKIRMHRQMQNSELEPWERVSAAIGISYYDPTQHKKANDVFKEADELMYQDKKNMRAGRE